MNQDQILILIQYAIIPLALLLYHFFVAKLPQDKQAVIKGVVSSGVHAVEQLGGSWSNEQKKTEAISMIQLVLKYMNIKVDSNVLSVFIEDAVFLLPKTA